MTSNKTQKPAAQPTEKPALKVKTAVKAGGRWYPTDF